MASFPCRGHDGSCLVLDIGTDATARIRAEEGVRVYSRKLDLCRRELREFTAAVARDVQEPSEAIVALCGRLAGRPSPDLRSGLDRVEATARRMSAMAAALLSYLDLTEQVEPFGPADLGLIAREAMSDLQPLIDRRNGSVEIGALPTVEADPGQMRVLFRSLVGAILRQQSEPRIRIDGQRCARPEDRQGAEPPAKIRVQIRVQDLIRDQLQDHSLDGPEDLPGAAGAQPWPAERLGNLLAGGPQGIGLAVCRRIVERHGGTLAAWGGYGGGSRYTFFLPERQRGMSVKTV
jgi:light-regulated signal transduction histidine kinase (bacteriophytochrome)